MKSISYERFADRFGMNICSYLIGSFQKFLEEISTHSFLDTEVDFKFFFICALEMVVKPLRKYSTWDITVATGGPCESKALTHYKLLGALWE